VSQREDRVRVFLADDHPVYRDGLKRAIKERPDMELVGVAEDGRGALEAIGQLRPHVAVLDVRMPNLKGPQVLRAIKRDEIQTEFLFLSAFAESDVVYDVLAAGAKGYLSKLASPDEVCEAISRISRGEVVLGADVQAALASEIMHRDVKAEGPVLTPREREVLRLVAEGKSAPEIGKQIHLSPTTVKGHLQTLYEKLGVSDRAAAVAEAMRRELLE
jgi:two-component system nitrate/nitrite response regulator NarL